MAISALGVFVQDTGLEVLGLQENLNSSSSILFLLRSKFLALLIVGKM